MTREQTEQLVPHRSRVVWVGPSGRRVPGVFVGVDRNYLGFRPDDPVQPLPNWAPFERMYREGEEPGAITPTPENQPA